MSKLNFSLNDLFNLQSAEIFEPEKYYPVSKISIDSRTVEKDSIFVAIKGEKLDGHDFVKDAAEKGAAAIVINKSEIERYDDIDLTIVTVDDTTKTYGELAKIRRRNAGYKIVSITGSNGKTSTKEMTADLLSEKFIVDKSIANNNNHIGVPLTILSAKPKTNAIVVEHGTNHFGEIDYTAKIAEPDIALITNVGDAHLEFLKNRNEVYNEKSTLLIETVKAKGKVLINYDDPILKKHAKDFVKHISYGFKGDVDIKGVITGYTNDGRTQIKIAKSNNSFEVELPVYGESNAKNYLAAVALALTMGLTKSQIVSGTNKTKAVKGRLNVTKLDDRMIIDDTYNSNPNSVKAAVDLLKKVKLYKRKILLLGDMFELGNKSKEMHGMIGEYIAKKKVDAVYSLGEFMKYMHAVVKKDGIESKHFSSRDDLKTFLAKNNFSNAAILVKGSRGMKMEEFTELFKNKVQ
ncbi:MAG: UDP-N-acetylmuramoyl-tripeptide--D-alanyl-D-alanine ligase [bacterium]